MSLEAIVRVLSNLNFSFKLWDLPIQKKIFMPYLMTFLWYQNFDYAIRLITCFSNFWRFHKIYWNHQNKMADLSCNWPFCSNDLKQVISLYAEIIFEKILMFEEFIAECQSICIDFRNGIDLVLSMMFLKFSQIVWVDFVLMLTCFLAALNSCQLHDKIIFVSVGA